MTEFSLLYNVVMSSPEPEAQPNISVRKVSSVRLLPSNLNYSLTCFLKALFKRIHMSVLL
jgi:hypothetical protein